VTPLPRIYVSIASFRDPECQHTVRDLFVKASYPERIFAGICWQVDPEMDKDCFVHAPRFPEQVREKRFRVEESRGGCWARAEALALWGGEEYILQIDAHMRFTPGWDCLLLDALARCPTRPALLSTMLPNYFPPEELQDCSGGITLAHADRLGDAEELQPLHLKGHFRPLDQTFNQPVLGAFFVGNFMFAPAEAVQEVPFDPYIYFRGQELVYSARLWTHGYDIYQPDRVIAYHHWTSVSRPSLGGKPHYKDVSAEALRGRARVRHVLGVEETPDTDALIDIDRYGMGTARSLEAYWRFSGLDLRAGTIADKAKHVRWTQL